MKRYYRFILLVIFFISSFYTIVSSSSSNILTFKDYKAKFSWLTPQIYNAVKEEKRKNNYDVSINFVFSVIEAESDGRPHLKGPWVRVKTSKDKFIKTRAIGLMQIIPEFHYVGKDKKKLEEVEENIKIGMTILNHYIKLAKNDPVKALKFYNSGPNKDYYNWKYINKIINLALDKNYSNRDKIRIL